MKRRTISSTLLRVGAAVLAGAVLQACSGGDVEPAGDTAAVVAQPEGVRAMLLAEVAHYEFSADSSCAAAPATVLTTNRGAIPASFQYASARLTDTGAHVAGRILGRITSSAEYPALGIEAGVNYVWRDSAERSYRLLVVPESAGTEMTWLTLGTAQYVTGEVTGLRCAVNQSIGICGGGCGPGHCPAEQELRALVAADSSSIRLHP